MQPSLGARVALALSIAVALLAALALSACGGDGAVRVTEEDDGRTISLVEGQTLEIVLDSNLTTGYAWNLVEEPDRDVLRLVGSEYEPDQVGPDAPEGGGGEEKWTFETVGAGGTGLELSYYFQQEPEQNAGSFSLRVEVRPRS